MLAEWRIGCAEWTIPKRYALLFPGSGSHLERYGARLRAVEINSSFYRSHQRTTYERWASAVPEDFAFAVKAPREITHERRFKRAEPALDRFLEEVAGLGKKLGPLLFQLPPSFDFDAEAARPFFAGMRLRFAGSVVCEPRHPAWFTEKAEELMNAFRIGRAAVDPPPVAAATLPGGSDGFCYFRLHGSPRVYYSEYSGEELDRFALEIVRSAGNRQSLWCIFDNTAAGAATKNALALQERLREGFA